MHHTRRKAILVPLLTGECDTSEYTSQSDAELRQCSTASDEYGAISATLDGQKIENLDSYGTATDFFNISYVKDNIFDLPAGTYRGIADGFFVFLKPLSVGDHELQIKTSVTNYDSFLQLRFRGNIQVKNQPKITS